ncbi:MAG: Xaa-Pro peptidase family protein [Planctomycetes bacterium]|nr:Xaa-Pro peptidase family protein [Planctomycetota bacterium]
MLTQEGCLQRQKRFRQRLASMKIDAAVITDLRDVYYFTGKLFTGPFNTPAMLFLATAGGGWLVGPGAEEAFGVDETLAYEVGKMGTMNPDWNTLALEQASKKIPAIRGVKRLAYTAGSMPKLWAEAFVSSVRPTEWVDIESDIIRLQRRKEPDEIALFKEAIRIDLAVYDALQEGLRPGMTELAALALGYQTAVRVAGEKVFHDGDYRCAEPWGPARNRPIQAGEMYVIDAWINYRGHWADLCRTFAIGKPTDVQQSVYDHVAASHQKLTPMLRPGAKGTDIWKAMDQYIRQHPALKEIGLLHHAGHGLGMRVHLDPDLNRDREGIIEEGDVLCFEPGGYNAKLGVYVRLENTYLVTATGLENLSPYPFKFTR